MNTLLEVAAYAQGAGLLRSMGMKEHMIYDIAARHRGEEQEVMDMLYGDLFPDPA